MPDNPNDILQRWRAAQQPPPVRMLDGDAGQRVIEIAEPGGVRTLYADDGRPDGVRPDGYMSVLEALETLLETPQEDPPQTQSTGYEGPDANIQDPLDAAYSFDSDGTHETIDAATCAALYDEAGLYVRRILAMHELGEYDCVLRDAAHTLRTCELCEAHAQRPKDRDALEPTRRALLALRTRALAGCAIRDGEPKAALLAINAGIEQLRERFAEGPDLGPLDGSPDAAILRGMRESLVPKLPVSQQGELRERIGRAVEQENYELAAILRDELRGLDAKAPNKKHRED